jgi:hypothetical protein
MIYAHMRLKRAAVRLVSHGWPVAPGAPLRAGRFDCGRPGCHTQTCHPALDQWQQVTCRDPGAAAAWWSHTAYSILLPTGGVLDVIEVPAPLGAAALGGPRGAPGPVAATPAGRWMFLVRPGEPLSAALARRLDVVRHAQGSWVPAPPTRLVEGPVRWVVSPAEVRWRLPESGAVQHRLKAALPRPRPHGRRDAEASWPAQIGAPAAGRPAPRRRAARRSWRSGAVPGSAG